MITAYIGLGSNLKIPASQLKKAVLHIQRISDTFVVRQSSLYRSAPMGPQNQDDFINQVIEVETSLPASKLLDELQSIETKMGRVRLERWGPRVIDLDILLYGQEIINDENLIVPHYGLQDRAFVIYPLAEINPELVLPYGKTIKKIKQQCPLQGLELYEESVL